LRVEGAKIEANSHDRLVFVELRAGSRAGDVAVIAQSSIMQPATSTTSPIELRDLVMAAPPW
jgi:hypothetical protein